MGRTKQACNQPIEYCPACSKPMNVCREEDGLYYCPDCLIHIKDGIMRTTNYYGEFSDPLAHVKLELKLAENPPEEKPQSIDCYFKSGDKKCFRDVVGSEPKNGWIILTKANGKEISINAHNVNYLDEI